VKLRARGQLSGWVEKLKIEDEATHRFCAEWLRTCREGHAACPSNIDVILPTRLLDVGPLGSDSIRLIVTAGQKGSYIALSHCWGGGIEVQTTKDNIEDRKNAILDSQLPATFQDAVAVARDLKQRYLWIDALCIVQDDLEDWEQESGNMAAVYCNAYIVLGADMSSSSHNGFLDAASGGYHGRGKPVAVVESENSSIYGRLLWFHNNPCPIFSNAPPEPLAKRAWTMQEQMLASRMVHFARKEMIWECNSALLCECMELDGQFYKSLNQHYKPTLTISPWSPASFKTWYRIVNEVADRNITDSQDILPCLSGLAQRFRDRGAGTSLAGLWLDDLLVGILWQGSDSYSRITPYRAPSWSWASVSGSSRLYDFTAGFVDKDTKLSKTFARVLEAKCIVKGKYPHGTVSDGYIKIEAPLLEMSWCRCHGNRTLSQQCLGACSTWHVPWFDFGYVPDYNESLFFLFIGEFNRGANGKPCRGLTLRRRYDAPGVVYERIGTFHLDRDGERNFIVGVEKGVVVIV